MHITFGTAKRLIPCVAFFLLFTIVACEKKEISFGEEFTESHTNIVLIDTVTPVLSTYKLDSFATSGTGAVLIGSYNDVAFGSISANSYLQIGIPRLIPDIATDAIFDSLTFILAPNREYYGDTTITQQISVHELTTPLEFAPEKTQFYNTTSFPFNPTPLGSKFVTPMPNRMDSIEILLSNVLGNDLFTKLKDKSADITDQEAFLNYFRGVVLKSTPSPSALLGFKVSDSSLRMRLYYRESGLSVVSKYTEFPVTNTLRQFNQLTINRTAPPLNTLPSGFPEISSASLGNKAYMQYSTGLLAKVMFPSLHELLNIDKYGKILKAELIIKPAPGTFDKTTYRPPAVLYLGVTDKNNSNGNLITDASGAIQAGNFVFDDLFGENTGYTFDITPFLQQQIYMNVEKRNGLVIYSPSSSSFNRLIIGDRTTGKTGVQVKIYYLVVR